MGTFEQIRKTSPYILALFAIVFIGFMVATDADISNVIKQGNNPQTAVLGLVNGEKLLYKDFENKVKETVDQQREQAKGEEAQIDETQIRRSLWDQMIDQMLIKQEAEKAGIFTSREEILDIMVDNPPDYIRKPFTDSTGRFNKEAYLSLITNPDNLSKYLDPRKPKEEIAQAVNQWRSDLIKIEESLKDQLLSENLRSVVNTTGSIMSPTYASAKYINENTKMSVKYIFLDVSQVPDNSVSVSNDEIQKYYDKIKAFHPQKPKRKIQFVVFPLVPSEKDSLAAMKAVKKISDQLTRAGSEGEKDTLFEKLSHEYRGEMHDFQNVNDIPPTMVGMLSSMKANDIVGPVSQPDGIYFIKLNGKREGTNEVVKASHILVNFGDNKDSALKAANEILKRAKGGEDFAMLARQYSEDKGSAMNGGDVGYFTKGRMVKPFEEAAFAAKVGSIVGPVETQFGYHIIKVTDKQSQEMSYTTIKITPIMSNITKKALMRNAKEIKDKVEKGSSFEDAAKYFNKTARESAFFEKDKPILSSLYYSAQAFAGEVGTVIEPMELKNVGIVVSKITDSRQEGYVPMQDLKDVIKATLTKVKKLNILKPKAEAIYQKVKSLGTLDNAASVEPGIVVKTADTVSNNGTVSGLGVDFAFTEKASLLPLNTISQPVRGELGYYIMDVTNRTSPNAAMVKNEIQNFIKSLTGGNRGNYYYEWFNKVKEDSKIEDNRSKHFKEY